MQHFDVENREREERGREEEKNRKREMWGSGDGKNKVRPSIKSFFQQSLYITIFGIFKEMYKRLICNERREKHDIFVGKENNLFI